jgi:hypothetical protein
VYGLDLSVDGQIVNVPPITFSSRNDYQSGTTKTGVPAGFHIMNAGTESGASVSAGKLILAPAPDAAYAYNLWYLPSWTDLASDTHVFNGIAGSEQWVIWDVCVKAAIRINDAKNQLAGATSERERAMDRIRRTLKGMNRSGAETAAPRGAERWASRSGARSRASNPRRRAHSAKSRRPSRPS